MSDLFAHVAVERATGAVRAFLDAHYEAEEGFEPEEVVAVVLDSVRASMKQRAVLEGLAF